MYKQPRYKLRHGAAHVACDVCAVCTLPQIKGYPTLQVVYKGETIKAYRGARELSSLKAFVEETVKELTSDV
jgi:thioredoxin domain-containing protein 5